MDWLFSKRVVRSKYPTYDDDDNDVDDDGDDDDFIITILILMLFCSPYLAAARLYPFLPSPNLTMMMIFS